MSNDSLDDFGFDDLVPVEIKFKIGKTPYILREADGGAATVWRDVAIKAATMVDGKVVALSGLAEGEPVLISKCLYYPGPDGNLQLTKDEVPDPRFLVPVYKVKSFPAKVQKKLFEKIKVISDLDEKVTKESLEKSIAESQKKLDALVKKEQEELATGGTEGNVGYIGSTGGLE